jgi:glycogen synthase
LSHHFSATAPAGKGEARKSLARRLTLSVGPRTLLALAPRLTPGPAAETLLNALSQLAGLDIVVVLPAGGDRSLTERARVLAIQNPGRMALVEDASESATRDLRASADAEIFVDSHDLTGRPAGLALRYGALPIAPDAGAFGDFLIDYDARSATGTALLYAANDAFELIGALRRAIALRLDRERWDALTVAILTAAPSWRATATRLESLCAEPVETAVVPLMA